MGKSDYLNRKNYNQISVIIIPGNHFRETSDNTKAMKKISQLWSKMRVLINQKNKLRPRNAMFFFGDWLLIQYGFPGSRQRNFQTFYNV